LRPRESEATILRVHAPKDVNAERMMKIVRRRAYMLANRYHRFAIEDLADWESDSHATSPRHLRSA
jgi:hypothetical protein